jgi:predicted hydrocarbon binding protein
MLSIVRQYRKDVIAYLRDPKKRFYHIVVELHNLPGALANVASVLAKSDLNVLSGFTYVEPGAEYGIWSLFAEDGHSSPEEVKSLLMSSPFATEVIINENKDGFISDTVHFPLTLNTGERAMLIRQDSFSNMLVKVRETFGTGGDVIIYDQGKLIGTNAGEIMRKLLPDDFIEKNMGRIIALYSSMGWFKADLMRNDHESRSFVIRVGESFECMGRRSKRPSSQFVRGHLTGFFEALFGSEFRCIETECAAAGSQHCEFSLVMSQVKKVTQAQVA